MSLERTKTSLMYQQQREIQQNLALRPVRLDYQFVVWAVCHKFETDLSKTKSNYCSKLEYNLSLANSCAMNRDGKIVGYGYLNRIRCT